MMWVWPLIVGKSVALEMIWDTYGHRSGSWRKKTQTLDVDDVFLFKPIERQQNRCDLKGTCCILDRYFKATKCVFLQHLNGNYEMCLLQSKWQKAYSKHDCVRMTNGRLMTRWWRKGQQASTACPQLQLLLKVLRKFRFFVGTNPYRVYVNLFLQGVYNFLSRIGRCCHCHFFVLPKL